MSANHENWITAIISAISGVTVTGITYAGWFKFKNKEKRDPIRDISASSSYITSILNEFRMDLGADRVTIIQFHNGERFHTGSHFQKMSVTHEVVSEGIFPTGAQMQALPVSSFSYWIEEVLDRAFAYRDVNDVPDYVTKGVLKSAGIQSAVSIPISRNGHIACVVNIAWIKEPCGMVPKGSLQDAQAFIEDVSSKVQSIIEWL